MFLRKGIVIPSGAKCCQNHLAGDVFTETALEACQIQSTYADMTSKELEDLITYLRALAGRKRLDFDLQQDRSSDDYYAITGLSLHDFNDLFSYIEGQLRSRGKRSPRTCLGLLLMKMKTGLSHSILSVLFDLSKSRISRAISSVRKLLMFSFVPLFLGVNHISRQSVINNHTSEVAKAIFSPDQESCILVLDATYLYTEKSSDYLFQRRSFSMHKGRNLVKPMLVVTTTGYILEVFGPFLADQKNNDANITNAFMKNSQSDLRLWLQDGDIFIVDRGFRDSLETLKGLNFEAEMPSFSKKGTQYCTDDANKSRLVTKIRYV